MAIPLLATKLYKPAWQSNKIARPHLIARLDQGFKTGRKLVLVSAPAGYGKTTIVAEWLASLSGAVKSGWLSLEESDNDIQRFLGYWLAVLQQCDPDLDLDAAQLDRDLITGMNAIINQMVCSSCRSVLVLDDYHVLANQEILLALEYFVEHLPPQLHLVIITREDPPLPLARLRASAMMTEFRAADLRFSLDEIQTFLRNSLPFELRQQDLALLENRTEGWAVGLQLAAMAMQRSQNPQGFIHSFRGNHRFVLDYLAEEVIRQQEPSLRQFLLQTSILGRFNADLCNALTARSDSGSVLAQLEQDNLFVVPLDDERIWYRYHHLFRDYLRSGLTDLDLSALQKKAATWFGNHEFEFEAVEYAMASQDEPFAAAMIEAVLSRDSIWSCGFMATLTSWLNALSSESLARRPLLMLHASRAFYLAGQMKRAELLLDQAEKALEADDHHLLARVAIFRGSLASTRGQVNLAIEQSLKAERLLPEGDQLSHARLQYTLGSAYQLKGDTALAIDHFLRASQLAERAGVAFLKINAAGAASQVYFERGELKKSSEMCQEMIDQGGKKPLAPLGLAWAMLAKIAIEQNQLSQAENNIEQALQLSRLGGLGDDLGLEHLILARLRQCQNEMAAAYECLEQAEKYLEAHQSERVANWLAAIRVRLALLNNDLKDAEGWADHYDGQVRTQPVEYLLEFEDITLARVRIAQGRFEAALQILAPLVDQAHCEKRGWVCLEGHILLSRCEMAEKRHLRAQEQLTLALEMAAPHKVTRLFLDEGEQLLSLLPELRSRQPFMVELILAQSGQEQKSNANLKAKLIDPLSEQEARVLALIVSGKSNREIAEVLVISVGTAKWHVHNVLQKLGVKNRPQAIARAYELGFDN